MARLNYNHLRYFWLVARVGRLAGAADRLPLSRSALSTQGELLEDQLGHALFERRGRGLELTEAGRLALDYADAIFNAGEELLGALGASDASARRVLRVGSLATLSRNFESAFLSPAIGRPDVALELRSGSMPELMADLEAHRLDIVLANQTPLRDGASRWIAHRVAEQPVSLIGAPERLGAERDPARLLATHPLIAPSRRSGVRTAFDALAMRLGVTPAIAAEVDDMALMRVLARRDAGLAVLPPIVVRDELASGRLVEAASLPELTETFSAITLQRRLPNPLVAELLAVAADAMAAA
ncbi:MAG: LysR substrate-binding domain-containing protein [Pseudomonadota bacterium]